MCCLAKNKYKYQFAIQPPQLVKRRNENVQEMVYVPWRIGLGAFLKKKKKKQEKNYLVILHYFKGKIRSWEECL